MKPEEKILQVALRFIQDNYQVKEDLKGLSLQKTRKEFEGDLTLPVFALVRFSKKSPEETAQELGEEIVKLDFIKQYNVVKGFLNLVFEDSYWLHFLSQEACEVNFGMAKPDSKPLVMVEYSSPNTNKPLHLGHLRNNFLGFSVSKILAANGHSVLKTQIINDRGIHICKSMLAWKKFGEGETPERANMKGDQLVGKYYVLFEKKYRAQVADLIDQGRTQEQAEKEAPLLIEAQEILQKWEQGETEVRALWEKMNAWVYEGFEATYEKMGVSFDELYYESDTYEVGRDHAMEGLKNDLFFKKEDGSIWVDLKEEGLDEKLLLRSDGTSVYMTQDIGTAFLRYQKHPKLNQLVYTVGSEQEYHFKVLFLVLGKLGFEWAKNCHHLSYGMVDLPSGRMKSREGTVVDADQLIDEMDEMARLTTERLGKAEDLSDSEGKELFHQVGMAALKYYLLKVDPKKKILFNPEESIDFQGHTGPFIQYTYARIQSVLRKSAPDPKMLEAVEKMDLLEHERNVIRSIREFPQVVQEAAEQFDPSIVANYVYELVKLYNSFYQNVSILKAESQEILNFRLVLSKCAGEVIEKAMDLLGIAVPQKM